MDDFLRYFYQDMGRIISAFGDIIIAIFDFFYCVFNFPARMEIIQEYDQDFSTSEWVLMLVCNVLLVVFVVVLFIFLVKFLRKIFRFHVPIKKYDEATKQIRNLQRDLFRANNEKDKLLAMRVAELGAGAVEDFMDEEEGEGELPPSNRNTVESPCVDPTTSRFFRLTSVDNFYKTEYEEPIADNEINLEQICEQFRLFAASELKLYYDLPLIRYFIASLGTARIIILQGISGTGKTSLPYAFGKFMKKDTTVVSVQPAWRERTELYGYFNEFTKMYTETEFLKAIYEANYYRTPHIVILDEMNIARVEYYFAEMLSILEMPLESEWKIDIVTAMWDNDPCLILEGKVQIPNNVWFIGTINNDDSTFAVADKVYDRAIPIDLDSRAESFECEAAPAVDITTDHLNELFRKAKEDAVISDSTIEKIEIVNVYLIKHFHLAFGNRIMKQLRDYVPCLIACGGTEMEAVDFMIAKKVLRKFESLSLGFMKDELTAFSNYLDKVFGKNNMPICQEYITLLKKNN